ncbi:MAG: MATE family efflux transporter [Burkholderiaceae bacterium]
MSETSTLPPTGSRITHRRVLRLALPIMLSNLSVPLVGVVDTAVMGRLPGAAQIGAVALGATVFSFLFWGFGFLRMGTTGLIAQAQGAARTEALRALLLQLMATAFVLGVAIIFARAWIGELVQWAFPATAEVERALAIYYGIRVWSAPAVLANYVLMGVFVGLQRTGFALLAQLTLNLANAGLSVWFVLGLDAGIAGVARASVLAEWLALAVGLLALARALRPWPGAWPWARLLALSDYRRLFGVNGDIFLRTLFLISGFAWFNARSAAQGEWILAANAVLLQLINVLAYGLDGFSHAAEALVGQARGARRRDDYRAAIRIATQWALGVACAIALFYVLAGDRLVAALTVDARVRSLAAGFLPWIWIAPVVAVWCYLLDGIYIGILRTGTMRDSTLIALLVLLAVSWPAQAWFGNHGLWAALMTFYLARAATLAAGLFRWPLDWEHAPASR